MAGCEKIHLCNWWWCGQNKKCLIAKWEHDYDALKIIEKVVSKPKKSNSQLVKKRITVFERDGYKCQGCGETNRKKLTIDHITPRSKGGTNAVFNLQTLCIRCNGEKGNMTPDVWRELMLTKVHDR